MPPRFDATVLSVLALLPLSAPATNLEETTHNGRHAYRLSDGKTEAVVVPSLSGRVMEYRVVGGPNLLWNAPQEKLDGDGYKNYGGDKTFVGPHSVWKTFRDKLWPPDPSWDGAAHDATILPGGVLQTTGNMWHGFEVRLVREFSMNNNGEFVIRHTLQNVGSESRILAIWPVTQVAPPDAVYIPLNPESAYSDGYHSFGTLPATAQLETLFKAESRAGEGQTLTALLKITPTSSESYKLGADVPVAAIVAVVGRMAFMQRADLLPGQYPDGKQNAGLPVEFYNHGEQGSGQYVELELLSPLFQSQPGDSYTYETRWTLHPMPEKSAAQAEAIKTLMAEQ